MADLRRLATRKRRRASTIVDQNVCFTGTDTEDGDSMVPETPPSRSWSRSQSRGSSRSTWTNQATTETGTETSAIPSTETSVEPSVELTEPFTSRSTSAQSDTLSPRTKFIIGLDYGTTFSSVSYIKFDSARPPPTLFGAQICSITDWPGVDSRARNIPEVPSESWYLGDRFYWGYGARQGYAKLLLPGNQKETRGPREELRRTLVRARKDETEAIKDYLRQILKYSKEFLTEREELSEECEVELVFCVPAGWPAKAIRTMQEILLDIAHELNIGTLATPFVLNEPEAAAAYILEACSGRKRLSTGEVFMVCDAGGGTVDAITYRVCQQHPFRVEEVVPPTGSNCGSSYANQTLKHQAIEKIKSTAYESLKGPSFEYIIEHDIMTEFEYKIKRGFNPADGLDGDEVIVVHGLERNERLGFGHNTMRIKSLNGISKLIRQQISAAAAKGLTVETILLVGGFSAAPILRSHIETEFEALKIIYPPKGLDSAVTVSHGAVFRAFNKSDGPKRIVQSNFGFLQLELYSTRQPAHRGVSPIFNAIDGKKYGLVLSKQQQFRTRNWQVFKMEEELVIHQKIWVSDFDNAQNHYRVNAPCNKGAEVFGILQIDLEPVKNEGLLELRSGPEGMFYEIHYELAMEVDGRNLAVKLFYPPGGMCRAQTQLCIAAAFIPGTE
ncbi:hypothetical protein AN1588.2 [Aspergillus nidulans FGSC A4]|uniref:HSP70 family protein (AFU_orthologue AFUA_3G13740) n=1 Tax=Emericella nidulans (strain FGSC A4 / ATCC 38163 / CBS 112.46 / NRRL 194 / M139) TaxID=227321 RepID=Q5BCZ2_EMENI|nr:hypothetical protein [Aspergillus nidulans FGSC A4]EAA64295.1 hypothetical protein AN1588.2 [Aspergillus nidulans FGSC A4]CBF85170.1 TPA: HSP70 family protein (AFU_orthologue; AFUA_3G13740) [Aspergillus nidulans FGSC A4]|eukprot:XP_659192.1 hypothetical protein AN1588.2 [Aspergillus nidulans FGSC A4]